MDALVSSSQRGTRPSPAWLDLVGASATTISLHLAEPRLASSLTARRDGTFVVSQGRR